MKNITSKESIERMRLENPWWEQGVFIDEYYRNMKSRAYLESLYKLIIEKQVRRAVVLMGQRRVGKTVLLYHVIQKLIDNGVDPKKICYISIDAPVYTGCTLEKLIKYYLGISGLGSAEGCYVFFDEIQYLKGWEIHLKKLVEDYRTSKFIVSGSAAAALKLKSVESGAGRFTNCHLPPLTFYEYLNLLDKSDLIGKQGDSLIAKDIEGLNEELVNYINMGGYPEALFSESIKADLGRYIRSDIIDKVLLRDLPSLYGIGDIQELNRLFMTIAYNTGNEISLDELSQGSGVAKNTIKKYLEYLEAAFLIKIIHRIDQSGKVFRKANYFKVYLTNPSMRCALFGPVTQDSEFIGNMVETAVFSQLFNITEFATVLYYVRWHGGEVDMVMYAGQEIGLCMEIKWSNRFFDRPEELKSLIIFAKKHGLKKVLSTTIDKIGGRAVGGVNIEFIEASVECYALGSLSADLANSLLGRGIGSIRFRLT